MLTTVVPDQRLRVGGAADLTVTWGDQHDTATAPSGAVTVRVQTADGTDVVPAGSSTTGTNPYTRAHTAAQNATLELLTATWTAAGDSTTRTTLVEVAGGFFFSIAEARAFDKSLVDEYKYSDARVLAVRREVEEECEQVTERAWVPRYRRVALNGTGERDLFLPDREIRAVRSVRTYSDPATFVAFDATQLAALLVTPAGRLIRPPGAVFSEGDQNIVVEYEHGHARPPEELKHAALARLRYRLNMELGIESAAAANFVMDPGGNLVEIDSAFPIEQRQVFRVYRRYSDDENETASATLEYQPSRTSLFHGGRR